MSMTSSRNRRPLPVAATLIAAALLPAMAAGCSKAAPTPQLIGVDGAKSQAQSQTPGGAVVEQAPAAPASGSPTQAFNRLRDAAIAQDWGAFYDGMGPAMRQADATDPAHAQLDASLSAREKFIKGMEGTMASLGSQSIDSIGADAFMAIWQGAEVKSEAVDGDRAILTITKDGNDWKELFVRDDGRWRFDGMPEGNGP